MLVRFLDGETKTRFFRVLLIGDEQQATWLGKRLTYGIHDENNVTQLDVATTPAKGMETFETALERDPRRASPYNGKFVDANLLIQNEEIIAELSDFFAFIKRERFYVFCTNKKQHTPLSKAGIEEQLLLQKDDVFKIDRQIKRFSNRYIREIN